MNAPLSKNGMVLHPQEIIKFLGLTSGMRVADFGCGHGHFSIPAAGAVGDHGSVFAIDIQKEFVDALASEARAHGLVQLKAVWADLEIVGATKIPDNSLDVVLMMNSRLTPETQYKIFAEALRVLKPAGQLAVVEWLDGDTVPFAPALDQRVPKARTLANALAQGLKLVDEFRPGQYHYGLKFQK